METDKQVILCSKTNDEFTLSVEIAKQSKLVESMLPEEGYDEVLKIPLLNVETKILEKIIQFFNFNATTPMADIDKPLKSADMKENVNDVWYAEFIDCPQDELFEIILAANYMDIKKLLDLSCAKVASLIKGKTPEEIRRTFNIKDEDIKEDEEVKVESVIATEN